MRSPEVNFSAKSVNESLHLRVQDFGRGMTPEEVDHIFDRFYRVEDKNEVRAEGSGLGLAIVKEFINLHNGEIHIESEPGKGSTFHITLPLELTND